MGDRRERGKARVRRHRRVRKRVGGTSERPRLNVFRSICHIYAQVIDDVAGCTLVTASSIDRDLRDQVKGLKRRNSASVSFSPISPRKSNGNGNFESKIWTSM